MRGSFLGVRLSRNDPSVPVYTRPLAEVRSHSAVSRSYRDGMRCFAILSAAILMSGCLTAGPGGCSAEEAAAFNEIDHFGDEALVPEDHPYGICGATFATDLDPQLVIGHYEDALAEAGWTAEESVSHPITDESGDAVGNSIDLTARKGSMTFSIGAELIDGPEPPTFNVLVGASSQ